MFKRKKPRTYGQLASELVYPPGGFRRATAYLWHRLRRLPDQPHRIARGMAAGVFLSFTPLHGFHFIVAALVSLAIRGNVLAAFLGTFAGNPLTTPFIALGAVGLGRTILGMPGDMSPQVIFREFAHATAETWRNVMAALGPGPTSWSGLSEFWHGIFVPYAVGGAVMGAVAATIAYYLTIPIVRRYHRRKSLLMARRIARIQGRSHRVRDDP
ncbi:DUF2062 domain-containing protein [Paracoccus subflavus]|uniref:DUF2062 domain-containing protein n=1 Tax=Paracoccus subflavus TaxID=2528244 RepID=A0A4Q9FYZ4_9RHOB|nr:DUF2062 domain-containing protein [Paracoccus subflavus]TBN39479.1 DUF2062 domain-containing protein [Paracoccus subflavus]